MRFPRRLRISNIISPTGAEASIFAAQAEKKTRALAPEALNFFQNRNLPCVIELVLSDPM